MRDGLTARRVARKPAAGVDSFLERFEATLVVVRGEIAGDEHLIDRQKLLLGRGPGVDVRFNDSEMSCQHAAIEFTGSGFRVCDLGSTNGTLVNGKPIQAHDLASGDRLELGQHMLQLRLEKRRAEPRVYCVPDD